MRNRITLQAFDQAERDRLTAEEQGILDEEASLHLADMMKSLREKSLVQSEPPAIPLGLQARGGQTAQQRENRAEARTPAPGAALEGELIPKTPEGAPDAPQDETSPADGLPDGIQRLEGVTDDTVASLAQDRQADDRSLGMLGEAALETGRIFGWAGASLVDETIQFGRDVWSWAQLEEASKEKVNLLRSIAPMPETEVGQMASTVVQFLIPYTGAAKMVAIGGRAVLKFSPRLKKLHTESRLARAGARGGQDMIAGGAVDFGAFAPDGERLSTLMNQYPVLEPFTIDWLANDEEDDGVFELRLKNATEGTIIGAAAGGLFYGIGRIVNKSKGGVPDGGLLPDEVRAVADAVDEDREVVAEASARVGDEVAHGPEPETLEAFQARKELEDQQRPPRTEEEKVELEAEMEQVRATREAWEAATRSPPGAPKKSAEEIAEDLKQAKEAQKVEQRELAKIKEDAARARRSGMETQAVERTRALDESIARAEGLDLTLDDWMKIQGVPEEEMGARIRIADEIEEPLTRALASTDVEAGRLGDLAPWLDQPKGSVIRDVMVTRASKLGTPDEARIFGELATEVMARIAPEDAIQIAGMLRSRLRSQSKIEEARRLADPPKVDPEMEPPSTREMAEASRALAADFERVDRSLIDLHSAPGSTPRIERLVADTRLLVRSWDPNVPLPASLRTIYTEPTTPAREGVPREYVAVSPEPPALARQGEALDFGDGSADLIAEGQRPEILPDRPSPYGAFRTETPVHVRFGHIQSYEDLDGLEQVFALRRSEGPLPGEIAADDVLRKESITRKNLLRHEEAVRVEEAARRQRYLLRQARLGRVVEPEKVRPEQVLADEVDNNEVLDFFGAGDEVVDEVPADMPADIRAVVEEAQRLREEAAKDRPDLATPEERFVASGQDPIEGQILAEQRRLRIEGATDEEEAAAVLGMRNAEIERRQRQEAARQEIEDADAVAAAAERARVRREGETPEALDARLAVEDEQTIAAARVKKIIEQGLAARRGRVRLGEVKIDPVRAPAQLDMLDSAIQTTLRTARAAMSPGAGPIDLGAFMRARYLLDATMAKVSGDKVRAKRLIEKANKIDLSDPGSVAKAVKANNGRGTRLQMVAEAVARGEDIAKSLKAIRMSGREDKDPTWWQVAHLLRYNSLLSGVGTQSRNAVGNLIPPLMDIHTQFFRSKAALGADSIFDERVRNEVWARVAGMLEAQRDGLRLAKSDLQIGIGPESWKQAGRQRLRDYNLELRRRDFSKQQRVDLPDNLNRFDRAEMEEWQIGGTRTKEKIYDVAINNGALNAPIKTMSSVDMYFKNISFGGELRVLAMRQADEEGLRGIAARERATQIAAEADPDSDMWKTAMKKADTNTFTNELGTRGQFVQDELLDAAGGIGRLVVPFYKTINNIFWFSARHTPGVRRLDTRVRENLSGVNGSEARADEQSRMYTGAAIITIGGILAMRGQLTGGGGQNRYLQRPYPDYSIRFTKDGTWFGYRHLPGMGLLLSTVANAAQIMDAAVDEEETRVVGAVTGLASSVVGSMMAEVWVGDVAELLGSVADGSILRDTDVKTARFFGRAAGDILPYRAMRRDLVRVAASGEREQTLPTGGGYGASEDQWERWGEEAENLFEQTFPLLRVFGEKGNRYPVRGLYGNPESRIAPADAAVNGEWVEFPKTFSALLGPTAWVAASTDPLSQQITDLGIGFDRPRRYKAVREAGEIGGVEYNDQEYDYFARKQGELFFRYGTRVVESARFRNAPREYQVALIREARKRATKEAGERLMARYPRIGLGEVEFRRRVTSRLAG